MQKLQTILVSVLIIVALFTSIYFPYKWKQLSNDFLDQTNQYGELLKQINDLQKEVRELKNGDGDVDELSDANLKTDETSDWKIYRNEEFGFEFKYPNNWKNQVLNNKSEVLLGCPDDDFAGDKKCLLTLSFPDKIPDINYHRKTWITIDSRNAEKYVGYDFFKFIINDYDDDNKLYKILLDYKNSGGQENKILDQIISTFKFTKQLDIDDWSIYNDDRYGFQLRYPEDFSVVSLEQTKNNLDLSYQNWIQSIFEREYFGNPIIIVISNKYMNFVVVHINEKDKGSECFKNDFLVGKKGVMMNKETTIKEMISKSDFYREEWIEGMDGSHFFNYRTVYNDKCFMMTTNLEDSYPNNPVKMELYDKIIHSFKFIE